MHVQLREQAAGPLLFPHRDRDGAPMAERTLNMVLPVAASRAVKVFAFDLNGNPTIGDDVGNWRGTWAAGQAYTVRDLVKDASNSNIYRCNTAHTSSGSSPISSNADVAK